MKEPPANHMVCFIHLFSHIVKFNFVITENKCQNGEIQCQDHSYCVGGLDQSYECVCNTGYKLNGSLCIGNFHIIFTIQLYIHVLFMHHVLIIVFDRCG